MAKLDEIDGVLEREADFRADVAYVVYDPAVVSIDQIEAALDEIGYRPHVIREVEEESTR